MLFHNRLYAVTKTTNEKNYYKTQIVLLLFWFLSSFSYLFLLYMPQTVSPPPFILHLHILFLTCQLHLHVHGFLLSQFIVIDLMGVPP